MKLDRFDIVVITAAAALLTASVSLAVSGGVTGVRENMQLARVQAVPPDAATLQAIQTAKLQLESGQVRECIDGLKPLENKCPTLGDVHALLGQAYARALDYPSAVREYRMALLIDPDYVDNKSYKFIGKRIKAAVRDCLPDFRSQVKANPDDKKAAAALKDALYLERMIAGGCE